ncbi:MAG TPA: hypothetical protein VKE22_21995 [Haliangiales bacterium]|nr:hypothetical protein [Haliangiales bacterium]
MRRLALCALCALAGACGSEPDLTHPSWRYIHAAIVVPNCATSGCHSTLSQTHGFDLQNRDTAYQVFTIGYPDVTSLLRGKSPNDYRMPPDQPLPEADIELIERWYADGAQDN